MLFKENSVVFIYTLFANSLNKFEQVWFNKLQSCFKLTILKILEDHNIYIPKCAQLGLSQECKLDLSWDEVLLSDLNKYRILVSQSI